MSMNAFWTTPGVLLVLIATTMSVPAAGAELQLVFEPERVVAEGLTPGADALLFGVMKERHGWTKFTRTVNELLTDDDQDGRVELRWHEEIPHLTILTVVDMRSGGYAINVPPGMTRHEVEQPLDLLVAEHGEITALMGAGPWVHAWLVDPGNGVWFTTVGDGTAGDGDGEINGRIRIDFGALHPMHGSPSAPNAAAAGAVLITMAPSDMRFSASRVEGGAR